ncbi:replication initiator protein A [Deinococcus sp. NW-56]|uniref:replication initiator protein A n=1 Tax=Deinococcus sp. NW-56 TaxID=2080419 RepID=UPI000CF41436|nr:replication initiator protein A [Deinococcus sp. NW-56]
MTTIKGVDNARINELDLARAGIVSASQAAPKEHEWVSEFEANGVHYRVEGHAHRGRPYGLDGDILLALQTLFFRAGCPENNRVRVPPAVLLTMTGLSRSAKDYVRLREGLLRIASVRWELTTRSLGKYRPEDNRTASTGLISDLWLDNDEGMAPVPGVRVSADSHVDVVFTATFAALIRDGLYQILDGDLMARLGSTPSRALYRCLAAHRIRGEHLTQELRVNLRDWLEACGIRGRTDAALRSLDASHERLIAEGYLDAVEDEGRGTRRFLTYRFRAAAHPELVAELKARGVVPGVAATLSADYPERVRPALHAVEFRMQGGWKPRSLAAAVVDAVKNPEKYGYALPDAPPVVKRKRQAKPRPDAAVPGHDVPSDPRELVRSLLRVKLKREASAAALQALAELSPEGVTTLRQALTSQPTAQALALTTAVLHEPL